VILYCAWQFRMKPGEELKDGPPIHGKHAPGGRVDDDPGDPSCWRSSSYSFVVPTRQREKSRLAEIQVGVTVQQFRMELPVSRRR